MTKKELSKYEGKVFYVLSTRMGGMFTDIHCLTRYEVTKRGTCKYICEVMPCVANKNQLDTLERTTDGKYFIGRPHAKILSSDILHKL